MLLTHANEGTSKFFYEAGIKYVSH